MTPDSACVACAFWCGQANDRPMLCPDHVATLTQERDRLRAALGKAIHCAEDFHTGGFECDGLTEARRALNPEGGT